MPAKFALDKTAPLQTTPLRTTVQTLLWLGALVTSAIVAALLIVTVFGSH